LFDDLLYAPDFGGKGINYFAGHAADGGGDCKLLIMIHCISDSLLVAKIKFVSAHFAQISSALDLVCRKCSAAFSGISTPAGR
jgi:hypothetical protein